MELDVAIAKEERGGIGVTKILISASVLEDLNQFLAKPNQ